MKPQMLLLTVALAAGCAVEEPADTAAPVERRPPVPTRQTTPAAQNDTVLTLTNAARTREGLGALTPNPTLTRVAQAHAENMARQCQMAHELDGLLPMDRVRAAGYAYTAVGENVACGNVPPPDIFEGWMQSPGHRRNILNGGFTEIGVGSARGTDGLRYYTQLFGTPCGPSQ